MLTSIFYQMDGLKPPTRKHKALGPWGSSWPPKAHLGALVALRDLGVAGCKARGHPNGETHGQLEGAGGSQVNMFVLGRVDERYQKTVV